LRKSIYYSIFLLLVLLIIQCSPAKYFTTDHSLINMDSSMVNDLQTDSLIKPYRENLEKEMNEVLVIAAEEFPIEKGKAQTKLGNLVADLSLEIANQLYQPVDNDSIDFCLLNFGGLRTSLPKGEITKGKIFELMPFENELVVVTISKEAFNSLVNYLFQVGGQPISKGLTLVEYLEQHSDVLDMYFLIKENKYRINSEFKILTSDYLANGGDNMSFFSKPIKIEPLNIKLRDAIIKYCESENRKGNKLTSVLDDRIILDKLRLK